MESFSQVDHLRTFSSISLPPRSGSYDTGASSAHKNDKRTPYSYRQKKHSRHNDSLSDDLSACTEGLRLESFNDVNDFLTSETSRHKNSNNRMRDERGLTRSRSCGVGEFPPPISSIGKCGKPFVSFKSFRQDGRFILKEIRIPELLHVCREDGRLKLHFIQSDDDDVDAAFVEDEKQENDHQG